MLVAGARDTVRTTHCVSTVNSGAATLTMGFVVLGDKRKLSPPMAEESLRRIPVGLSTVGDSTESVAVGFPKAVGSA